MLVSVCTTSGKRRGRPCASERYNNELIQQKLTSLINSPCTTISEDFARLNVIPFIVKRQRRVRANDRERNRMQTLNEALLILQQCIPAEFLSLNRNMITNLNNTSDSVSSDSNCNASNQHSHKHHKGQIDSTKLTKIDTLKLATKYIEFLASLLHDECSPCYKTSPTISSTSVSSSPNYCPFNNNTTQNQTNVIMHETSFQDSTVANSSMNPIEASYTTKQNKIERYNNDYSQVYYNNYFDTSVAGYSNLSPALPFKHERQEDFNHNTIQFCQNYAFQNGYGQYNNYV